MDPAVQRPRPDGWTPKISHHELGDNYGDTFRVEDGLLKVRYDRYQDGFKTQLRSPVLREAVFVLPAAHRVPLRRRAGGARTGRLGEPQQRHHVPLAAAADDDEGTGLPDLDRGAAARRPQRRQGAPDGEHVLARHRSRLERRAVSAALPRLGFEDLRRRSVGARWSSSSSAMGRSRISSTARRCSSIRCRRSAAAWSRTSIPKPSATASC